MRAIAVISLICTSLLLVSTPGHPSPRIILVRESFPDSSQQFYARLKEAITRAGAAVEETDGAGLAARLAAKSDPGTILVLPNAPWFPVDAKGALEGFLKRGNHLLAFSGPAFSKMVTNSRGRWLTRETAKADLTTARGRSIVDFAREDLSGWKRLSGAEKNPASCRSEPSGEAGVPDALHVSISRLDNWDTLLSPVMTKPFSEGSAVTAFWAKGGPRTPEMLVEWREKDGSRWMAVVKLTPKWAHYALAPDDFRYWSDNPSIHRGGPGDQFHPDNAEAISFGLASGISSQELGIPHEFWVSDIRAVPDEYAGIDFTPPVLESLSPAYKTYHTFAARLQSLSAGKTMPAGFDVTCAVPRPPGLGCDSLRKVRWIPLVRALDAAGDNRGAAAHIYLNTRTGFAGSIWASIGLDQPALAERADSIVPLAVSIVKKMHRGVFLANAGAEHFAYDEGEQVRCGAYLVNVGQQPAEVRVRFGVVSGAKRLHAAEAKSSVPAGTLNEPLLVGAGPWKLGPGLYTAEVSLVVDGQIADRTAQQFRVIRHAAPDPRNLVTVHDGDFYLNGRKWHAVGVNYWPRYSVAQESGGWGSWLSPEQYNPGIVEQDLALAGKLGINLFSIQYTGMEQARCMMDFLARAQRHGIKVIAFIPGLHPLQQDFRAANALVSAAHLPESEAFFAYDVGWEVHVGKYAQRREYDPRWRKWVLDNYGSVEAAEKDWGFTPGKPDGGVTGPSDDQLTKDGEWRVYVAAYRRFWDDELSRRYSEVRANIRSLDKRHLIGARSGYGGTGSLWAAQFFPFDLASGARHLDFTSPEGYALAGDRLGFLKGGILTLYGRLVSAGKPVYWAEYGPSVWPQCDAKKFEAQRAYYENMLDMVRRSGANGSAAWWWPGGLRVGENSDFGIVNPDGSPRPAALELRKYALRISQPSQGFAPTTFIDVDRDKHPAGIAAILADQAAAYVDIVEKGATPALRTQGTGTTSADTPMVAVGNVPCTGHNPAKYLNAEFDYVKINGRAVRDGETIEVERGKPVVAGASVGNTAEAKWLGSARADSGTVWLAVVDANGWRPAAAIASDTPFLGDALVPEFKLMDAPSGQVTVTFRMLAVGRTSFGEVLRVTLRPRG